MIPKHTHEMKKPSPAAGTHALTRVGRESGYIHIDLFPARLKARYIVPIASFVLCHPNSEVVALPAVVVNLSANRICIPQPGLQACIKTLRIKI